MNSIIAENSTSHPFSDNRPFAAFTSLSYLKSNWSAPMVLSLYKVHHIHIHPFQTPLHSRRRCTFENVFLHLLYFPAIVMGHQRSSLPTNKKEYSHFPNKKLQRENYSMVRDEQEVHPLYPYSSSNSFLQRMNPSMIIAKTSLSPASQKQMHFVPCFIYPNLSLQPFVYTIQFNLQFLKSFKAWNYFVVWAIGHSSLLYMVQLFLTFPLNSLP